MLNSRVPAAQVPDLRGCQNFMIDFLAPNGLPQAPSRFVSHHAGFKGNILPPEQSVYTASLHHHSGPDNVPYASPGF